jgi:selenoprotein W-related protein
MAQELLVTFERELTEVALRPGAEGVFQIDLDDAVVWSRATEGRFPELKELKQLVRDRIAPDRALGHSDRPE